MKSLSKRHALAVAIGSILTGNAAWGQQGQIETVIVTAEFHESDVQDTPVAITAVNAEMLDARAETNVFEVAAQAPNVTLKPGGQARSGLMAYIRGIGQSDFIAALEPGVGVYVDDVYYSQLTGSLLDLLDLDRVEILRGPQGTLAGRNSIGGAIRLFSKPAGSTEGGTVSLGYGSYEQTDVRGMADFVLSPGKLYARVAGASRARNGYIDVLDYACTHPGSGVPTNATGRRDCKRDEFGDQDYVTGRANIRWTPSDRLQLDFTVDFLNDSSGSAAATLRYADRTAIESTIDPDTMDLSEATIVMDDGDPSTPVVYYRDNIFVPYGPYRNANDPINDPYVNYATLTDPNTAAIVGPGNSGPDGGAPRVTVPWKPLSLPSRNYLDQRGLSMNITWDISDRLSLKSITAYREYETWMTWDSDLSPMAITMLDNTLTHDQTSQEFRLNGTTDSFDYTIGTFYFDQYTDYTARVDLPYAQIDFVHGPDPTPATTWAVFGNATWNLTDRLGVSAGVRYSDEYKVYTHHRHNPDYSPVTADVAGPTDPLFFVNIRVSGLNGATAKFTDDRTDWRLALSYDVTDSTMLYASAATGYKSGGVNPRPFFIEQLNVFEPETLTSYELGIKSALADNSLRLNAAFFTTDYEDIQLILLECEVPAFVDPDGIDAPCLKPANVGNADINGLEVEAEWYVTDNLSIDASLATLSFDYKTVNPLAFAGADPSGMITPYTPELQWAVGLQYGHEMSNGGTFNFRIDASFQDDIYTEAVNNPFNKIDSYTLTNGKIWWDTPDDEWELALEVRNLTDELYYYTLYDQHLSVGQVQAQPAMPRTWLVSVKRSF